jgi:hypothetical protein
LLVKTRLCVFLIGIGATLLYSPSPGMTATDQEKVWLELAQEIALNGDGEQKLRAPDRLSAQAEGPFSVSLTWQGSARFIFYYQLDRRAEGEIFFQRIAQMDAKLHSYLDKPLEPGKRYFYRVRAIGRYGASPCSNTAEALTMNLGGLPASPSLLTAKAQSSTGIEISWQDNSNNEEAFELFRCKAGESWKQLDRVAMDQTGYCDSALEPGQLYRYKVRAANRAGPSEFSKKAEAQTSLAEKPLKKPSQTPEEPAPAKPLSEHIVRIDPIAGRFNVNNKHIPAPQVEMRKAMKTRKGLLAEIQLKNGDSYNYLEDVHLEVAKSSSDSLVIKGADFGIESGKVKKGIAKANPPGYQYKRMINYPDLNLSYAQARIGPACSGISRVWEMDDVDDPFTLTLRSFGRKIPFDLREDPRFREDLPLWVIRASSLGVPDGKNVPGSPRNATSRPITYVYPGEIIAVSVGVEADDPMERQRSGAYDYFHAFSWVLTYDPEVVSPLKGLLLPDGTEIPGPVSDAGMPGQEEDDGWDATRTEISLSENQGWIRVKMNYAEWSVEEDAHHTKRRGQEGFTENGIMEGVDHKPELILAVIYFQAIGESGLGTLFGLGPGPQTAIYKRSTKGTPASADDDIDLPETANLNPDLPNPVRPQGLYQVQEAYICIR